MKKREKRRKYYN